MKVTFWAVRFYTNYKPQTNCKGYYFITNEPEFNKTAFKSTQTTNQISKASPFCDDFKRDFAAM